MACAACREAAHDQGDHGIEHHIRPGVHRRSAGADGGQECGDGNEEAAQHITDDLDPRDVNAGVERGVFVGADHPDLAAEGRVVKEEARQNQADDQTDQLIGKLVRCIQGERDCHRFL